MIFRSKFKDSLTSSFSLFLNGVELDKSKTVGECAIPSASRIVCKLPTKEDVSIKEVGFQVRIAYKISTTTTMMKTNKSTLLASLLESYLKSIFPQKFNPSWLSSTCFFLNGRPLDNEKTLEHYGITANSLLVCNAKPVLPELEEPTTITVTMTYMKENSRRKKITMTTTSTVQELLESYLKVVAAFTVHE